MIQIRIGKTRYTVIMPEYSEAILEGVFAKNERGYRLNAIKSAFDCY